MNTLSRTLLATVLLASPGLTSTAFAANLACKPDVKVTNNKPASIKVLKFKYKVSGNNTIYTEGLANRKIAANGDDETWKSQKLGHAATGIVITETAVDYKDDNSGAGDGYGPSKTSPWFPHTFTCGDNHTYVHTIE